MLLLLLAAVFTFSACGGDDGGGSSESGGDVTPSGSGTYSQADLVGVWTGFNSDGSLAVVMGIYQDGTGELVLFRYENSDYVQIFDEKIKYQFNTNSGELFVTYSDNSTEKFMITNQTYNSFTFYVNDTPFYMERYTDDNGGGNSSQTGYAPENVSNCTFIITHYQNYRIYFTSNTTVRPAYSYVPLPDADVTGGSYTKTGPNTATVVIEYRDNVTKQNKSFTFDLTFTSSTGGVHSETAGIEEKFTIEYEQYDDYISAPEYIRYMKFTISSATGVINNWWQFGAQYGTQAEITSYGGNGSSVTYYRHYANYFRNSNESATLTIFRQGYEGSSTHSTTYNLEFQTSSSGRFTSSSYSSFTGETYKTSGTFTLE